MKPTSSWTLGQVLNLLRHSGNSCGPFFGGVGLSVLGPSLLVWLFGGRRRNLPLSVRVAVMWHLLGLIPGGGVGGDKHGCQLFGRSASPAWSQDLGKWALAVGLWEPLQENTVHLIQDCVTLYLFPVCHP